MINLTLNMLLLSLIPITLLIINSTMTKKKMKNQEKTSPFECGFDPLSPNRQPFSIQFFLISLMFLIFDIEIILLIPLVKIMPTQAPTAMYMTLFFLLILTFGLYFEYLENSLEWKM